MVFHPAEARPRAGMVEAHGDHGAGSTGSIFQMLALSRE